MPLDRGVVDQQLKTLGEGSRWWDVRELRDLPAVLSADEHILAIARGKIARVRLVRRAWLILVTDQRLLCLRSGGRMTWRQLEVPVGQITRVTMRAGPFKGRVLVEAGDRRYPLLLSRPDAHKLLAALSTLNAPGDRLAGGFGPTRVVKQVFDHILALPGAALDPEPQKRQLRPAVDRSRVEERLEAVEAQVQELQQQVEFLEQLLQQRHEMTAAGGERR